MVYKCNSCGAITDTEATAKALGYGSGTKISLVAPSKCGICGSKNILQVSSGK
jgi:DNA-directed RNA polymerase subunit RPC12/RpoP